ncbi:MAG: ROK family protein [Acidobacteria bacterium]|nr:ROK family protein [Acidobacteriota bacterium]
MKTVIGVDIGGTKIAAGVVNERAETRREVTLPTLAGEPLEASLGQVYSAIGQCLGEGVSAIGICAPGPLNPKTGVVINPPNLPHWRNVPLARLVGERFGLPCRVENDANAAGLAEVLFGAARGMESVLYVTLSTGIGVGIILNGRIYHGKNGAAAEGGHVTIDYRSKAVCNCGVPGCIEVLASGTAMAGRDRRYPTAESIGAGVAAGEAAAVAILDDTCEMLAAWMGSVVSLLDPDVIVVGGGVSRIGEPLFTRLRRLVPGRTINQFAHETPIVAAGLAGQVGIVGAAAVMLAG